MSVSARAFVIATLVGTVLQLLMIWAGHTDKSIADLFAIGGMGFSLVAGLLYAVLAGPTMRQSALPWAAASGATCAFIGIFASYLLKDVPATLLALGTLSSSVTGLIGGAIGRRLR